MGIYLDADERHGDAYACVKVHARPLAISATAKQNTKKQKQRA